ncbi:MAG: 2'-5' RNA ligase [Parcubacteria group bacterium LiPW_15]|nr:MAG: 2'-5' RNA ligase [Parcubacteria group bacterium LiPW_15]
MIRVFVGIPISEELREKIGKWAESHKDWPLRFVSGTGLHITLVPPWYAENSDCAVGQLDDIATAVKPFNIKFKKITFGTSSKRPRLIWTMGEDYDKEGMLRLKAVAEAVFGQKPEVRPYSPHLTIARFKEEDFGKMPTKELDENVDWEMEVNFVVLYESKLHHSGAEYEILKKIELKG